MALLQFEHVSFAYPNRGKRALDDVSFQMEEGSWLVLCGPSGCGKTTLLRQAKKEMEPAGAREGKVFYRGMPLEDLTGAEGAAAIGFVQQHPDNQIVTDYVWHELAFGLENMGLPTQVIRRRVAEMASFFGITGWYRKKTSELSGGQKQLLNLASILAMNPGLLVLDEPTSMLDPLAADNFLSMIKRIHEELGIGILMTEHRLEKVLPAADQVLVLEEGQVTLQETPREAAAKLSRSGGQNRLYPALPAAVRIFGRIGEEKDGKEASEQTIPLTPGEGRRKLRTLFGARKLREEAVQKTGGKKSSPVVLTASELWFRYEEKGADILRGLSLGLEKGRLLCLLGGNGAGKTTLLKILCGIKTPFRGRVRAQKGERVGYLPQNTQAMFTKDTVEEELEDSADTKEAALKMAEQMELSGLLRQHPYDLSGGETQRLGLAKLLLGKYTILLLDEPTKGMDAWTKEQLGERLRGLCASGLSILLVTHDLDFAAGWSDKCALLFDGLVHSEDEPHAFFAGNQFYTTQANRIGGEYFPYAITCEEVIAGCRECL